jgi:hypothetical protein
LFISVHGVLQIRLGAQFRSSILSTAAAGKLKLIGKVTAATTHCARDAIKWAVWLGSRGSRALFGTNGQKDV